MTVKRIKIILSLLFFIQSAVIFFKLEYWPLNPYRMFSGYKPYDKIYGYRLEAVFSTGERVYLDIKKQKVHFLNAHARRIETDYKAIEKNIFEAVAEIENKKKLELASGELTDIKLKRIKFEGLDESQKLKFKEIVISEVRIK